ncbi:MAG: GH36-type glycosyl hydrolase domain-containing protein, partial [Candidatus Hermodarchaeota archaeon]
QRIFGIGYYRKRVIGHGYVVDQIVFAPFGDDPVLISQVKITNSSNNPVDLRWIEYWGNYVYQFSSSAFASILTGEPSKFPRDIRHDFSNKIKHNFDVIPNRVGLVDHQELEDQEGKFDPTYLKPTFVDRFPPKTFLVSLDAEADSLTTNGAAFFGQGGVEIPDCLNIEFANDIGSNSKGSAMLLERGMRLNSGESRTLSFLYGYIPEKFKLQSLISKYKENVANLFEESCQQWKNHRMELQIQEEPWVNRELFWHYYYLRGAMTYDSFFKEHILSQGHVYQYIIGFQGAARDPLQHALPFVYTDPSIVKNVIRYTLKTTRKNGEIPWGITGCGQILPIPLKPSDQGLWLLWLVSEYVLGTRDVEFLDEEISRYPCYGSRVEVVTVREIIARCYKHITKKIGIGRHGLQRLSNGDWNDNVVFGHISEEKHKEIQEVAESVLNASMAIYVLRMYSNMLKFINEDEMAENVLIYSNSQQEAVRAQWNGKWVRRAWLTEELGWIGDDKMWLEPQPWVIIGNAINDEQKLKLVHNIDELMRKPSKIGALILNRGLNVQYPLGQGTNGGIWPSINGTLIWALSLVNGEIAWDEWKKNSLAYHAEYYPEIWYGIWSGPDTYNSSLSKYPGQTAFNEAVLTEKVIHLDVEVNLGFETINWTDFPVFNLHPHAWPLFSMTRLVGINFTPEGVEIRPTIPREHYKFSSSLIGFEKTNNGYSGWYNPIKNGKWKISLEFSKDEIERIETILVNNDEYKFDVMGNRLILYGESQLDRHLTWEILFKK